jgi:hypothetical protein
LTVHPSNVGRWKWWFTTARTAAISWPAIPMTCSVWPTLLAGGMRWLWVSSSADIATVQTTVQQLTLHKRTVSLSPINRRTPSPISSWPHTAAHTRTGAHHTHGLNTRSDGHVTRRVDLAGSGAGPAACTHARCMHERGSRMRTSRPKETALCASDCQSRRGCCTIVPMAVLTGRSSWTFASNAVPKCTDHEACVATVQSCYTVSTSTSSSSPSEPLVFHAKMNSLRSLGQVIAETSSK